MYGRQRYGHTCHQRRRDTQTGEAIEYLIFLNIDKVPFNMVREINFEACLSLVEKVRLWLQLLGKGAKICEIFLSCAFFSSTWHLCLMASVINQRAQKGEPKESHNK